MIRQRHVADQDGTGGNERARGNGGSSTAEGQNVIV
jgi:hypothetical protein